MMETVIVIGAVAAALFFTGRAWVRTARGKDGCAGCAKVGECGAKKKHGES